MRFTLVLVRVFGVGSRRGFRILVVVGFFFFGGLVRWCFSYSMVRRSRGRVVGMDKG